MVYGECLSCVPWIPINLKFPVTSHSLHYIKAPWHHNEKVQSIAKLRTFPQYLRTQLPPGKGSKFILGHVHHFRSLKSRVDVPNSRGGQSQISCVNHTETAPSSSWKGATAPPSRDWPRDKTFRPFSGAKSCFKGKGVDLMAYGSSFKGKASSILKQSWFSMFNTIGSSV